MEWDAFVASLEAENKYARLFAASCRYAFERSELIMERKGEDLAAVVEEYKTRLLPPIVDKKLRLVFGCKGHGFFLGELFRYHFFRNTLEKNEPEEYERHMRYLVDGHGWYISSVRPNVIVHGSRYRPDAFDGEVFAAYAHEEQTFDRREFKRQQRFLPPGLREK